MKNHCTKDNYSYSETQETVTRPYDKPNRDGSVLAADHALAANLRAGFEAYRADGRGIAREHFAKVIQGLAAICANLDDVNTDSTASN